MNNFFYHISNTVRSFILFLVNPKYWLLLSRYDSNLDKWMYDALKSPDFQIENKRSDVRFIVVLHGMEFWIANSIYGFSLHEKSIRPSRANIDWFFREFNKWKLEHNFDKHGELGDNQ